MLAHLLACPSLGRPHNRALPLSTRAPPLSILHQAAGTTAVPDSIVPGSVPVTGTYSRTEAEYQAAMRQAGVGTVSERTDTAAPTAVEERPVAVGVAEVSCQRLKQLTK